MKMEHRWAPRRPTDWNVTITHPAGVLLSARIRNISSGGALVETSVPLATNTPVELILPENDGGAIHLHRLQAVVARCDRDSAGLIFKNIEPETLATLLKQTQLEYTEASEKKI